MQKKEFSEIRNYLGKSQKQIAQLLCISTKAIQSYEQGWRNIPANIERQLLFLYSLKKSLDKNSRPCWEITKCADDWRQNCTAWELKAGHLCWFISGTFCMGKSQDSWGEKIKVCRECYVFRRMLPEIGKSELK
jgi:DNA-binding XRE family transcriptional regulator